MDSDSGTAKPSTSSRTFKIVTFSIVALSAGLAVPFFIVRKRNIDASSLRAHSIVKNAGFTSPAALLARSSALTASPGSTTLLNSSLPPLPPPPPPVYRPLPGRSPPKGNPFENVGFALKAFGIATGIVISVTGISVITFRWWTGIRTVPEFSTRMRTLIDRHFPIMQSRLYKGDPVEDHAAGSIANTDGAVIPWTVEKAEERLKRAYDEGGWQSWASQAVVELNQELQWRKTRKS